MSSDTTSISIEQTADNFGKTVTTWKNGKKNGPHREYYISGELCAEANYKDDKLDGEYLIFYANGKLKSRCHYKEDISEGKYEFWDKDGQILEDRNFINGKVHGEYLVYYKNGKLKCRAYYDNGIIFGKCKKWHENGQVSEEYNYSDGKVNGEYLEYYDNGKLKRVSFIKNDAAEGICQKWYSDGQKSDEFYLTNNLITGYRKIWSQDGKLTYHDDGNKILVTLDKKNRNCALPDGEFECWKACKTQGGKNVYVKLVVPSEAKRMTAKSINNKGRVEYAKVVQIIDSDRNEYKEAHSFVFEGSNNFKYELGEKVVPDKYDDNYDNSCGHGISVFMYRDMCDEYFK